MMKMKMKRTLSLLLALLLFSLITAAYADPDDDDVQAAQKTQDAQKKEDDAQRKQDEETKKTQYAVQMSELQTKLDAKKAETSQTKDKLNKAKSDTQNAKAKLEATEAQIRLLAEQIALLEEQIDLTNQKLETVSGQEKEQYALFCSQVRQEEERGSISYWSVLFKAHSFSDLLSRMDFVSEIMEYNNRIIDSLKNIRGELSETKAMLEEKQAELDAVQKEKQAAADAYDQQYQEYKKMQSDLQAKYDADVADEKELENLMKEVERKVAELGITGGGSGGYIWPVKVATIGITSKFGPRVSPTAGASTLHNGIDIGVSYVNCYAAKAGVVTLAGTNGGFGQCVIISHGKGYSTVYGHLSTISVRVGDAVAQGDKIAVTGNSGISTGPHLDFRIMENYTYVNPLNYLSGYTLWC